MKDATLELCCLTDLLASGMKTLPFDFKDRSSTTAKVFFK